MRFATICLLFWLVGMGALAQDSPDAEARRLFEEGLALSETNQWAEAADRFERSLSLADRPAARFNLVNAYVELGRPLDVARHAVAFLSLPAEPHRAEARASVEASLGEAARQLAVLSTQSVPGGCVLLVDGQAPAVRDATRVFVSPGLHRLEARIPGAAAEVIELHVAGGQELPWPRQGHVAPSAATPLASLAEPPAPTVTPVAVAPAVSDLPDPGQPAWRSRLSIATGTLGAITELTAVGVYALTLRRANELSRLGARGHGYITGSYDYYGSRDAIAPLAIAGGVLMAQAMATGPRSSRWGSRTTAVIGLAAGAGLLAVGAMLLIRSPDLLENTGVEAPTRQLGALLVSGAGPFISYGTSFLVRWYRSPRGVKLALGPRP
jgi:hypothetical protein